MSVRAGHDASRRDDRGRFGKLWLAFAAIAAFAISACAQSSPEPNETFRTPAARLAAETGRTPVDYDDPDRWACSPERQGDVCDQPFPMAEIVTDGTVFSRPWSPDPVADLDCFYIYPTVDLRSSTGNHDNLDSVELPEITTQMQAAPFGDVCRVVAPHYRQGTIGSYSDPDPDRAARVFLNAFADVAAAFEYYLREFNNGRRMVIMGHSQGAQMASYLLHTYFDGSEDRVVTDIEGNRTVGQLRDRLVLALPIGFNVFTPAGADVGGSFAQLPLCVADSQHGCVIHYRSYPEGFAFKPSAFGSRIDARLAEAGLLNRGYETGDQLACVNPSRVSLPVSSEVLHPRDTTALTDTAGTKLLAGTWLIGPLMPALSEFSTPESHQRMPGRYTGTCRAAQGGNRWLAIGLHNPAAAEDQRGDPFAAGNAVSYSGLGLHLYDFNLPMEDLIAQVRMRARSHSRGAPAYGR